MEPSTYIPYCLAPKLKPNNFWGLVAYGWVPSFKNHTPQTVKRPVQIFATPVSLLVCNDILDRTLLRAIEFATAVHQY